MFILTVIQKKERTMNSHISTSLENLEITHKGVLQTRILSAALKGRERQFMLLLIRNDETSKQACIAMLAKIDIDSLIARGFLKYNEPETMLEPLHNNNIDNEDVDPILQLAAGTA